MHLCATLRSELPPRENTAANEGKRDQMPAFRPNKRGGVRKLGRDHRLQREPRNVKKIQRATREANDKKVRLLTTPMRSRTKSLNSCEKNSFD